MSNKDNFFDLESGMFTTCSKIWDKEKRKYSIADSTDIHQCCSKQCIKPFELCYKYCNQNTAPGQEFNSPYMLDRCIDTCIERKKLCLDVCVLSSNYVSMDNNYFKCSENYDCLGIGNLPDKDCVNKHKDEIFKCCRKSCIPTKDLNCQKYCEYMQNSVLNPKTSNTVPKNENLHQIKSRFKIYPDNTLNYIMGGVVSGIIFIIISFIIKQM